MPKIKSAEQFTNVPAKDIPFGGLFFDKSYSEGFMRVQPMGYILGSTLVNEAINCNKVFAVRISNGHLRIIDGDRIVIPKMDHRISVKGLE